MDTIGFLVVFFVVFLVILAVFLENLEQRIAKNREKLRIFELQAELERLKALPQHEVDYLRGEGFDVKKAIFECETGLLIRMDTIR